MVAACSGTTPGGGASEGPGGALGASGSSNASSGSSPGGAGGIYLAEGELRAQLETVGALTPAALQARYPASFESLGYDPSEAEGLDRIAASSLSLNDGEQAALVARGFVISDRQRFPNHFYGYKTLYFEHVPLFVSADSIMYAVHRSYDALLSSIESQALQWLLLETLTSLRARLPQAGFPSAVHHDLDLFLSVAYGLLSADAEGLSSEAQAIVGKARAARGIEDITLFGRSRAEDFSQFAPRGHYVGGLENYFRAMIWLGRVDFRLLETQPDHSRVLVRPAVDAALALDTLIGESERGKLNAIDAVIRAFVGEADYMTLEQVGSLRKDLGAADFAAALAKSDSAVRDAILAGGYGVQRISSHLMQNGVASRDPLPTNLSFALLGQRYVLDSHVFSNVTYSRVPANGGELRLMPNPLDVAFAALGNNQALPLLATELERYGYAGQLGQTRVLADAHPESYWQGNLYNQWLDALRQLSKAPGDGGPSVTKTEAWGRRILSTQLASWAELRHDTLLYAKQSYTDIPSCEYPDAYVEPYPALFEALERFAQSAKTLVSALRAAREVDGVSEYFDVLGETSARLRRMAEQQLSGTPHSAEDLAFINQAVRIADVDVTCSTIEAPDGWYAKLFYNPNDALEADPTIADVHTQPADETGSIVGNVLHVGTGSSRLMVVTVDTCSGPRAYAGVVSSYFEKVTSNFERLTDEVWAPQVTGTSPDDPAWLEDVVQR